MNRYAAVAAILIALLIACCLGLPAQEQQNPAPNPAPRPEPKLTNWYKVELTLNELEDGKKTNTRTYTMEAEENGSSAVMKLGDRVPVATGVTAGGNPTSFQYIEVGLNITCWVRERQGRLGLTISVEQSSIAPPTPSALVAQNQPMIRQLRTENTAFVTLGKSTLIASVDDPGKANHKYTVEATVTKLNP